MPGADFDEQFAAGRKASQTRSFFIASLSLGSSETEQPEREVHCNPHRQQSVTPPSRTGARRRQEPEQRPYPKYTS